MNRRQIRIGLDFHGVINQRPGYFAAFSQEADARGYEIHVISGGPFTVVSQMLQDWGIKYHKLFSIVDYYQTRGELTSFANGEFKVPDKLWDRAKAEYCAANGINIHIDDSSVYAKWFTTPYCHYEADSQRCRSCNAVEIDFSADPALALSEIERLVSQMQFY